MKEIVLASLPGAIPTLTVLIALLINQVAIGRLASEISGLRKQQHDDIGRLDAKIDALSRQITDGIVMLMGRDTEKAERLAKLEERTKSMN